MNKEAKARIKINKLLEAAGWRFFDDENGPANIALENNAKITEQAIDAFGEDFEKTKQWLLLTIYYKLLRIKYLQLRKINN